MKCSVKFGRMWKVCLEMLLKWCSTFFTNQCWKNFVMQMCNDGIQISCKKCDMFCQSGNKASKYQVWALKSNLLWLDCWLQLLNLNTTVFTCPNSQTTVFVRTLCYAVGEPEQHIHHHAHFKRKYTAKGLLCFLGENTPFRRLQFEWCLPCSGLF